MSTSSFLKARRYCSLRAGGGRGLMNIDAPIATKVVQRNINVKLYKFWKDILVASRIWDEGRGFG